MGLKEWLGAGALGYKFLSEFASLWELDKLKELGVLGFHLKNEIAAFADKSRAKDERINAAFAALQAVLDYKKANPQDFEDIFAALERFLRKAQKRQKHRREFVSLYLAARIFAVFWVLFYGIFMWIFWLYL